MGFHVANGRSEVYFQVGIENADTFAAWLRFHYQEAEFDRVIGDFDDVALCEGGEMSHRLFESVKIINLWYERPKRMLTQP